MDSFGDIIVGIGVLLTLASFGIATFAAFGLMAALGLFTEMSFRRIFFISFGVALFLPILFGGAMIGVLSEESNQQEIAEGLREVLPSTEQFAEELTNLNPVTPEERQALEDNSLSVDEREAIEQRIEGRIEERVQQIFPDAEVQVDDDGVRITTPDNSVDITID